MWLSRFDKSLIDRKGDLIETCLEGTLTPLEYAAKKNILAVPTLIELGSDPFKTKERALLLVESAMRAKRAGVPRSVTAAQQALRMMSGCIISNYSQVFVDYSMVVSQMPYFQLIFECFKAILAVPEFEKLFWKEYVEFLKGLEVISAANKKISIGLKLLEMLDPQKAYLGTYATELAAALQNNAAVGYVVSREIITEKVILSPHIAKHFLTIFKAYVALSGLCGSRAQRDLVRLAF